MKDELQQEIQQAIREDRERIDLGLDGHILKEACTAYAVGGNDAIRFAQRWIRALNEREG